MLFLYVLLVPLMSVFPLQIDELTPSTDFIIAYDCLNGKASYKPISLASTKNCVIPETNVDVKQRNVQVIQKNRYRAIPYISCHVHEEIIITDCSALGYTSSVVYNGFQSKVTEVTQEQCRKMRTTLVWTTSTGTIVELKANNTVKGTYMKAGFIDKTGNCKNGEYITSDGTQYSSVAVQSRFTVMLYSGSVQADLDEDTVRFPSGQACKYTQLSCLHYYYGYSFWQAEQAFGKNCRSLDYNVLYKGKSEFVVSSHLGSNRTVMTVSSEDYAFALELRSSKILCETTVFRTDHPQIFVLDNSGGTFWDSQSTPINAINVDFTAYVNTKFVYVERHTQAQAMNLYRDLLAQKCKVEKMAIQTLLTLAAISPEEFAFALMNRAGYTAILAGEIAYVGACTPISVAYRSDDRCWLELPVTFRNDSYFITPRGRLLTQHGHEIPCNPMLPVKYKFTDGWYSVSKHPVKTEDPEVLSPGDKFTWHYEPLENLVSKGLYTRSDLEKYQKLTLSAGESDAISNTVARRLLGQSVDMSRLNFQNVFDERSYSALTDSIKLRLTKTWYSFGEFMAPFLGIWFCWKIITSILGCGASSYALHSRYGWNWKLLLCCCFFIK